MSREVKAISPEIRDAFNRIVEAEGGYAPAAVKLKMVPNNVSKIVHGDNQVMLMETYVKCLPALTPYLHIQPNAMAHLNEKVEPYPSIAGNAMPMEIKSVCGSSDQPVINVSLTEEELFLLKKFRMVSPGMQDEAIALLTNWNKMPSEKQKQMVDCARKGEVCESVKHGERPTAAGEPPMPKTGTENR